MPITDKQMDYARQVHAQLVDAGIRATLDDRSEKVNLKIRDAQLQKVPYMLVLGDREIEARTAAPRTRAGEQQAAVGWDELAQRLADEAGSVTLASEVPAPAKPDAAGDA